jgi:hypothetical protein
MVTMDMTGWTPVYGKDGAVLGYTAPADAETPLERTFKDQVIEARSAALDPVADLYGCESFDIEAVSDACGLSEDDQDSAANVAWTLMQVELGL